MLPWLLVFLLDPGEPEPKPAADARVLFEKKLFKRGTLTCPSGFEVAAKRSSKFEIVFPGVPREKGCEASLVGLRDVTVDLRGGQIKQCTLVSGQELHCTVVRAKRAKRPEESTPEEPPG
jgi:hypothetical protein